MRGIEISQRTEVDEYVLVLACCHYLILRQSTWIFDLQDDISFQDRPGTSRDLPSTSVETYGIQDK